MGWFSRFQRRTLAQLDESRRALEARTEVDAHLARQSPRLQPGEYVCLSVQDSGVGMAPQVAERSAPQLTYAAWYTT